MLPYQSDDFWVTASVHILPHDNSSCY